MKGFSKGPILVLTFIVLIDSYSFINFPFNRKLTFRLTVDKENIIEKLDEIFISHNIRDIYLANKDKSDNSLTNEEIKFCEMSTILTPFNETFKLQMIDFDRERAIQSIKENFKLIGRKKPLLAITKGIGSGKTRTIEELRIYFQLHESNTLAIPISFNGDTQYDSNELNKILVTLSPRSATTLSVLIRILVMFYKDTEFVAVKNDIAAFLNGMFAEKGYRVNDFDDIAVTILHATLCHIKTRIQTRSNKNIENFVLFIDESAVLFDKNKKINVDDDIYSIVRKAILDVSFDKVTKCALLMSSLNSTIVAEGLTDSGRQVSSILLASELDVEKIVKLIWEPTVLKSLNLNGTITSNERNRLLVLASLSNTAPRIIEIINTLIEQKLLNETEITADNKIINNQFISDIHKEMFKKIYVQYGNELIFPQGIYLKALILGDVMKLDDYSAKLVRQSSYVNQVTDFSPDKDFKYIFRPQSNIAFLNSALLHRQSKNALTTFEMIIKDFFDYLLEYDIQEGFNKIPAGDLLEQILIKWTAIKLLSYKLMPDSNELSSELTNCSLRQLFRIDGFDFMTVRLNKLIDPYDNINMNLVPLSNNYENDYNLDSIIDLKFNITIANDHEVTSSVSDMTLWKNDLMSYKNSNVAILNPCYYNQNTNEHYDLGLLFRSSNKPYVVFMDCKSSREPYSSEIPTSVTTLSFQRGKTFLKQYFDVRNLQDNVTEKDLITDTTNDSYLRAIYEGNWLYIYMTTYDGPNLFFQGKDFKLNNPEIVENSENIKNYGSVMVLNRDTVLNYLSIISEIYKVIRNFK